MVHARKGCARRPPRTGTSRARWIYPMPEVWMSKYDFSLDVVFMVNLHWDSGDTPAHACGERCVTPRWVDKAKASATKTGGRSRTDAVRAGRSTRGNRTLALKILATWDAADGRL